MTQTPTEQTARGNGYSPTGHAVLAVHRHIVAALKPWCNKDEYEHPVCHQGLFERERHPEYTGLAALDNLVQLHEKDVLYTGRTKVIATDSHGIIISWLDRTTCDWIAGPEIERVLVKPEAKWVNAQAKDPTRTNGIPDMVTLRDTDFIVNIEDTQRFPDYSRVILPIDKVLKLARGLDGWFDGKLLARLQSPLLARDKAVTVAGGNEREVEFYCKRVNGIARKQWALSEQYAVNKDRTAYAALMPLRVDL